MEKMIRFFSKNTLLVNLILVIIFIIGIACSFTLKQDSIPSSSLDMVIVHIIYPGAAPVDVELNAIIPIEKKIKNIKGIKDYVSLAVENMGRITITIDSEASDIKGVKDTIFRELNNVPDLDPDVKEVKIIDVNPDLIPVYEFGVNLKDTAYAGETELYQYVDKLKKQLAKVKGVGEIKTEGYRKREIKINVNPGEMDKYYISLNDIVNSIKSRNVRVTGGTLQSLVEDKSIVTLAEFENPMEVGEVIIRSNFNENRVRIKDIATVIDDFEKENILIKVNSKRGVTLQILKNANADVVRTAKNVRRFLKSVENEVPDWAEISKIDDQSLFITSLLNIVKSNAFMGFILVIIVLFIFLGDFKTAFWTAFGIPVSVLLTLIYMKANGISLNLISIGAIITVLGMLVDDGIVIAEIIHVYKLKGHTPIEAAIHGVKEVVGPVAVTIISTIVAFFPIFYIRGIMGKFIYVFPQIVIATLIFSFIEAICFLPNHLAHGKTVVKKKKRNDWFEKINSGYEKFLNAALPYRYLIILGFVLFLGLVLFLSKNKIESFVLSDDDSSNKIYVLLEASKGNNLKRTSSFTGELEDILRKEIKEEELISLKTTVGNHAYDQLLYKGEHENWAMIQIHLVPFSERKRKTREITKELNKVITTEKFPNFEKIEIKEFIFGPPTGAPIDIKIIGSDKDKLMEVRENVTNFLTGIEGVINIDDDVKLGKDDLVLNLDYEKMGKLGVNVATVAEVLRVAYEGSIATSIQTTKEKLDFRVKIDDSYQKDITFLQDLLIPNIQNRLIQLKDISSFKVKKAESSMFHYNGEKVITITANIEKEKVTPNRIMYLVKERFNEFIRNNPDVEIKFGGEVKETMETIRDLRFVFLLAVFFIYCILIFLFKSLSKPIIIMLTIPFGIIGALLCFVVHDLTFTFTGVIGMIGLSGIVVNDSIIMVDFINKVFKENKDTKDKKYIIGLIAEGAKKRLRPVVITTITTVFGLLPTAYGIGGYSGIVAPIALGISYGLLFATLVTLIFIPALYLIHLDLACLPVLKHMTKASDALKESIAGLTQRIKQGGHAAGNKENKKNQIKDKK